jgi:hypothetical protein
MIDAQSSAFAAQIGVGSTRVSRVVSGVLAGHTPTSFPSCPPPARYKNAEIVLSFSLGLAHSAYPKYPSFILLGLDAEGIAQSRYNGTSASQFAAPAPFKIKKPSPNARKTFKVISGKLRVILPKKIPIFSGHFYGKSLANQQKMLQKTRQITP